MNISAKITKMPDLKLILPDKSFYQAAGLDVARTVIKRTQSGKDVEGKSFRPYSKPYALYRAGRGRQVAPVNLTFTAKMLNAVRNDATNTRARVYLSGVEGGKAWQNTLRGRRFFDISNVDMTTIVKGIESWMAAKNGLK